MELSEKEKYTKEIESHANKACELLTDNYNALLAVVPQRELLNEIVVKNFSLYTSNMSDTRAKILKMEILDFWKTATPYKMISQTMLLQKFVEVWRGLKGGKFHYNIDNFLFKIILASTARIDEYKVIDMCHFDPKTERFATDTKAVESYVTAKFNKANKQETNNENNNVKNEIEK